MSGVVKPVEEQEVLVDPAPLVNVETGAGPPRRLATKVAAAVALSALLGTALVAAARQAPASVSWAKAVVPSALWEEQHHHQDQRINWHQDSDDHEDQVACGAGEQCTCAWASAAQCNKRDMPQTRCWSCCCRARFPENFHWAMSHQEEQQWGPEQARQPKQEQWVGHPTPTHLHHFPDNFEGGRFHRGADVNVQSARGHWHPATVLNHVSQGRYEVQYDVSRQVEVVKADQIVEGMWTPWWVWVGWVLLVACILACVVGLVGFLLRRKDSSRTVIEDATEEVPILKDDSADRSCTTRACFG